MDLLETCGKCGFELSGSCYENRKKHEVEIDFQKEKRSYRILTEKEFAPPHR